MAGLRIPQMYPGNRHPNDDQKINGVTYYYLLAVDEMETYLTNTSPFKVIFQPDDIYEFIFAVLHNLRRNLIVTN
jgi:hypothetical protein